MKTAALLAICTAFLASARQPSPELPVRVNIRVLNVAHVPEPTLAQARLIVDHILGAAGIRAVWLDCDSRGRPCSGPQLATDLWLQLLRERPRTLEPDTAGYALLVRDCATGCGYAAVSYPAVQAAARDWGGDPTLFAGSHHCTRNWPSPAGRPFAHPRRSDGAAIRARTAQPGGARRAAVHGEPGPASSGRGSGTHLAPHRALGPRFGSRRALL